MTKAVLLVLLGATLVFVSFQVTGISTPIINPKIAASDCSKSLDIHRAHGGMGGMGAIHSDLC